MIAVDLPELERLCDLLKTLASNTDETLNLMRKILSEMQEDMELQMYSQSAVACEAVSIGINAINRGNDMLQSLKGILYAALEEYKGQEQSHKDAIHLMSSRLDHMHTGLAMAVSAASFTAPVERCTEVMQQNKVQELVAASSSEMQLTMIAAVTKTVNEEYGIEEVRPCESIKDLVKENSMEMQLVNAAAAAKQAGSAEKEILTNLASALASE